MTADYPIDEAPATPEYVLALFRELFRDWDQPDDLTFEMSVSSFATEWNDTILFWRELARSLNDFTGLALPLNDWKPVLYPMRSRTVRDICEFVAARLGSRLVIRPWRHMAGECLPAGAFLTARSLLARSGVDPDAITPGTPLGPYLTKPDLNWLWTLIRLAPGRLPPLTFSGLSQPGEWVMALGGLSLVVGMLAGGLGVRGIASVAFGMACTLVPLAYVVRWLVKPRPPRRIELPGLVTFRDLAYCLAGQRPRRSIQPTP